MLRTHKPVLIKRPLLLHVLALSGLLATVLLNPSATAQRNLIVIVADDLGVDVSNGYHAGSTMPITPTLDSLRQVGLLFENAFATPKCTPSRAAMISGTYGVKTGAIGTPGTLDTSYTSVFRALSNRSTNRYRSAVIGKWHLKSPADPLHPNQHGVDHFIGVLGSGVADYSAWARTANGQIDTSREYVTSQLTDDAIAWVGQQQQNPWLLWMAHVAPHGPVHLPPDELYARPRPTSRFERYLAMIEAMDTEIGRLLRSLTPTQRDSTTILYVGDNGTPNNLLQDYPAGRGKTTLYQGGVRVPLMVAGADVQRKGQREAALVHVADFYATLLALAGVAPPRGGEAHSLSFAPLLQSAGATPVRPYNYTEVGLETPSGYVIRDAEYKLITFDDGSQEFYHLPTDSFELRDLLLDPLSPDQEATKADLEQEALAIRTGWSCRDLIRNGDETDVDCGGSCAPCSVSTSAAPERQALTLQTYLNADGTELVVFAPQESLTQLEAFDHAGRSLGSVAANAQGTCRLPTAALSGRVVVLRATTGQQEAAKRIFVP